MLTNAEFLKLRQEAKALGYDLSHALSGGYILRAPGQPALRFRMLAEVKQHLKEVT